MVEFDEQALYQRIDDLVVEMDFTTELGFTYLQRKLGEVYTKTDRAADLVVYLTKLQSAVRQRAAVERALFDLDGKPEHKAAYNAAKEQAETLKAMMICMATRRERLRSLPKNIQQYSRLMADALQDNRGNNPDTSVQKRGRPVPSAFSSIPQPEHGGEGEDESDLDAAKIRELFG